MYNFKDLYIFSDSPILNYRKLQCGCDKRVIDDLSNSTLMMAINFICILPLKLDTYILVSENHPSDNHLHYSLNHYMRKSG